MTFDPTDPDAPLYSGELPPPGRGVWVGTILGLVLFVGTVALIAVLADPPPGPETWTPGAWENTPADGPYPIGPEGFTTNTWTNYPGTTNQVVGLFISPTRNTNATARETRYYDLAAAIRERAAFLAPSTNAPPLPDVYWAAQNRKGGAAGLKGDVQNMAGRFLVTQTPDVSAILDSTNAGTAFATWTTSNLVASVAAPTNYFDLYPVRGAWADTDAGIYYPGGTSVVTYTVAGAAETGAVYWTHSSPVVGTQSWETSVSYSNDFFYRTEVWINPGPDAFPRWTLSRVRIGFRSKTWSESAWSGDWSPIPISTNILAVATATNRTEKVTWKNSDWGGAWATNVWVYDLKPAREMIDRFKYVAGSDVSWTGTYTRAEGDGDSRAEAIANMTETTTPHNGRPGADAGWERIWSDDESKYFYYVWTRTWASSAVAPSNRVTYLHYKIADAPYAVQTIAAGASWDPEFVPLQIPPEDDPPPGPPFDSGYDGGASTSRYFGAYSPTIQGPTNSFSY
jgi:hypothetical protein